jgi:CRP-like cAMP-binding protein
MNDTTHASYDGGNRLIDGLPPAERGEASGGISRGEPITAAYFPIDSVFSVLVELDGGDCYEADSIGHEGFIGGELLLGAAAAARSVICQIGGQVAQMPLDAFERCAAELPVFAAAVHRGLLMQWYRAQQNIACNFAHPLVERCARWTLLTHDAVGRDEFPLRAEYLAMMLGVQTHVVTEPMAVLQTLGAIRYTGSCVTMSSEARLREAACACYSAPGEFRRQLEIAKAGSARSAVARDDRARTDGITR